MFRSRKDLFGLKRIGSFVCYTCPMTGGSSRNNMLEKARTAIKRDRMVQPGAGVVVGVSGGPDSVALLHVLHRLRSELDLRLVVAHLDHAIRPDSSEDADFVRALAHDLGINPVIKRVDVRSIATEAGVGVEEAGREVRYHFFEEVRVSAGAHVIATAHQRDDVLETFFLRILRGSSLVGLRGIPAVRGRIVRPLIDASRTEILCFLEEEHIPYRIDPSNLEIGADRNFIRNRLFPVIRERFPNLATPVYRTLALLREDEEFLAGQAAQLYDRVVQTVPGGLAMDVSELALAPRALASRVVLAVLYAVSGTEVRMRRRHIQAILEIIRDANPSARMNLPGGLAVRREYGRLFVSGGGPEPNYGPVQFAVQGPGTLEIPGSEFALRFRVFEKKGAARSEADGRRAAVFDADKAPFPLTVRSPLPGDRFRPWGMEGTRKIKKVLIDVKMPIRQRRGLPLLVKDDIILWIPGVRRSREAPVTPETRRVLEVTLIPEESGELEQAGLH
jgi:tRNA(Ile)-lysidine synthase